MKKEKSMYFIDVEASSLSNDSYPIALALIDAFSSTTYKAIIKPMGNWSDWSIESERVHGIHREMLFRKGERALTVALNLNRILKQETVYCDSPYDMYWIKKLFDDNNVKMEFLVEQVQSLMGDSVDEFEYDIMNIEYSHDPLEDVQTLATIALPYLVSKE